MKKVLTTFLITITAGTLIYLLGYPASVAGNAEEDAAQRYQEWVDAGSPDWNAILGGGNNQSSAGNNGTSCTKDAVIDTKDDCQGELTCTRNIHTREDCSTYEGGLYGCRKERGSCGYYGVCRPRYCDTNKQCSGACVAQKDNTCGPDNGLQGGCVFTEHSSGKACVPQDTDPRKCQVDACKYPNYACYSVFQRCVYTLPWLNLSGGNAHLNK